LLFFSTASDTLSPMVARVMTAENAIESFSGSPYTIEVETLGTFFAADSVNSIYDEVVTRNSLGSRMCDRGEVFRK